VGAVDEIEVSVRRIGPGGAAFIVVSIGGKSYGATGAEWMSALEWAARSAAADLARRGRAVDAAAIVEQGVQILAALEPAGRAEDRRPPRE
jgi:hypothetical protein